MVLLRASTLEDYNTYLNEGKDSGDLVIVEFYTPSANKCKDNKQVFEQAAVRYPDIYFIRVDSDRLKMRAARERVTSWPTYVYYRNRVKLGKKVYEEERPMGEKKKRVGKPPSLETVVEDIITL